MSDSNISLRSSSSLPFPTDIQGWDDDLFWGCDSLPRTPKVDLSPEPLSRGSSTSSFTASRSLTEKDITKVEAASVIAAWGGMVIAGGIAGALGASPGIIAGIAVGVFFGVGLIGYGVSTYLESKEVTPLRDGSDDVDGLVLADDGKGVHLSSENSEETRPVTEDIASRVQQTANKGRATSQGLPAKVTKVINQARETEIVMNTPLEEKGQAKALALIEKRRRITENLKKLNKQIKVLQTKFVKYAVNVGFAEALEIVEKEITADAEKHGPLLYFDAKKHHGGVNLRTLILEGTPVIENVKGERPLPTFSEIEQGILSNIQSEMLDEIQKRFDKKLVHKGLAAATDLLPLYFKKVINISDKQFNKLVKSGFNESSLKINQESIAKNLGDIYRYNPSPPNPHFNRLVQGAVRDLLSKREKSPESVDAIVQNAFQMDSGEFFDEELAFNDNGRTIAEFKTQVTNLYNQEVEKIKEKEIQKIINAELPLLENAHANLQEDFIVHYTQLRDAFQTIADGRAKISSLHRVAIENAQAGEIKETDQTTRALVNNIIAQKQKSLRSINTIGTLNRRLQAYKDTINKMEKKVCGAKLAFPAYPQKALDLDIQIQTLLNECRMLDSTIDQFVDNSLHLKAAEILNGTSEILNGTAPTVVQKVTGGVTYGVSAAYSGLTYISGAIWNRVPVMPTLGGWFGGSKTPATTETAEITNADDEVVIDGVTVKCIPKAKVSDFSDSAFLNAEEEGFVPASEPPSTVDTSKS